MRKVGTCTLTLLGLLMGMVAHAQYSQMSSEVDPPGTENAIGVPIQTDDESCEELLDDETFDGIADCAISCAHVDADSQTLQLEGSFCDYPRVLMGNAQGGLTELVIQSVTSTTIVADLGAESEPGTCAVIVECPCEVCRMDVTFGAVGPTGATGPTGPQGPTGTQGAPGPQSAR